MFCFRRVTNHTTPGMAIKTRLRHRTRSPIVVADAWSVLPKTLISAPGVKPAIIVVEPKHKPNKPGKPHKTTATRVAIKLVFFLFTALSYKIYFVSMDLLIRPIILLTSQLRTDFLLQTPDDLIADRGGFGVGHGFVRLICEAVCQ